MYQYIDLLIREYSFCVFSKKKSIINLDNFYLLLYIYWIFNNSIFKNKQQQVQIAIDLFITAFFDCRLYFLFDIQVKFDNSDNSDTLVDKIVIANFSEIRKVSNNIYIDRISNSKSNCNNNTRLSGKVDNSINKY